MKRLAGPGGAVVLALLGAVLALLSASRPWVHALVQDPILGRTTVTASGRQAAPVVPAVALVALAGGVALLLARTLGRRVAGVLLVLAGAAGAAATVSTLRSPAGGVDDLISRALGTVGTRDARLDVTGWPWLAVVGAVLVVTAGAMAVLRARAWAAPRARFEPPTGLNDRVAPTTADAAEADPWDALSRGDDPTS